MFTSGATGVSEGVWVNRRGVEVKVDEGNWIVGESMWVLVIVNVTVGVSAIEVPVIVGVIWGKVGVTRRVFVCTGVTVSCSLGVGVNIDVGVKVIVEVNVRAGDWETVGTGV